MWMLSCSRKQKRWKLEERVIRAIDEVRKGSLKGAVSRSRETLTPVRKPNNLMNRKLRRSLAAGSTAGNTGHVCIAAEEGALNSTTCNNSYCML